MKNSLRNAIRRLREKSGDRQGHWLLRWLWGLVSHNLWLKLLSLLLAILLWNYVISTNTSITRPKILYGLTGYVSGQTTLNSNGLALLEDPETALSGISVTVEAPQANYSRVSSDNVQVTLDLSTVRAAGTQEVRLRANSAYGRVTGIVPASVTLTFEQLDSRSVPVNCQIVGDNDDDYWYNIARVNPSVITVSGAASAVRSIASACVYVDVTDVESATVTALPYVLLNGSGEEIAMGMLNRSTSSISISLEAYPSRDIPVANDAESVLTGKPAEGYEVTAVSIQPESIQVAADSELLDSVDHLNIEPVSVEGMAQSFSAKAALTLLSDFRYVSNEEVYVNVTIEKEKQREDARNVSVDVVGLENGATARHGSPSVVLVGTSEAISAAQTRGVRLTADVSGLTEGTYQLAPTWDEEAYPDLTLEVGALEITITEPAGE